PEKNLYIKNNYASKKDDPPPGQNYFYPFRFINSDFGYVTRDRIIRALNAEGIPCSSGYGRRQNRKSLLD
ncbi:MAG: hypothetical protein QUS12_01710, partial [Methanosarcina sp.]|nr:hypothetical protein [Methanosarcina sp.]